jgi:environmental stress-induced protein Ves
MQILRRNALVDVPWKNGGGVTRSIAKGLIEDRAAWTISRADVAQDGPFSDFAGMTRVLTVVSGGTMILQASTQTIEALMWQPVRFDGALKVHSRLTDGPLTDLNLMFDAKFCDGYVTLRRDPFKGAVQSPERGALAFHILSGAPQIDAVCLTTGDTAFIDAGDVALQLTEGDAVLELRLEYVDHTKAIKLCIAAL